MSGRRQTDLCRLGFNDTLPDYARSVNRNAVRGSEFDIYRHNPWRAPGAAPVADACGLAGGWPWGGDGAEETEGTETDPGAEVNGPAAAARDGGAQAAASIASAAAPPMPSSPASTSPSPPSLPSPPLPLHPLPP